MISADYELNCYIEVLAESLGGPRYNTWYPHHTKEVKKWYQWFPCLALIIKRETLTLSQIAIIISLRALWKIDLIFFKYYRNKQTNIDPHRTG